MMQFGFLSAAEIRFGRGTAGAAPAAVAALARAQLAAADYAAGQAAAEAPAVLLVRGAAPERAAWARAALAAEGLRVVEFACPQEPDLPLITAGLAQARAVPGLAVVMAVGGGAVIDCGKALAALLPAPHPVLRYLEVVGEGQPLDAPPLPFVALPTTAGTGAEVTMNAVIGVPAARRKVSLRDRRMLARLAIVDPALTDACPRAVTLASGMDALVQVIEPYLSSRANPLCDALCLAAIPRALSGLMVLMGPAGPWGAQAEQAEQAGQGGQAGENSPARAALHQQARDDLAFASLCGGLALANSGLGAVHGLAGPLGGMAKNGAAPHGAICALLLGPVLAANAAGLARAAGGQAPQAARLAQVCDLLAQALGAAPSDLPKALKAWLGAQGLMGLGALGLAAADIPAVALAAGGSSSMRGNPVPLSPQDLEEILRAAW